MTFFHIKYGIIATNKIRVYYELEYNKYPVPYNYISLYMYHILGISILLL